MESIQASMRSGPPGDLPEIEREAVELVRVARDAFDSRTDLRNWLTCVFRRRVSGGLPQGGRCSAGEAAAVACAVRFKGQCARAIAPRELDEVIGGLPTRRLEALLVLERDRITSGA